MDDLTGLMSRQSGVVSRRQALAHGLRDHEIRTRLRRRVWAVVYEGVYVDHTGPLTGAQLAWAAVLVCAPSALWGQSAIDAAEAAGRTSATRAPVHVGVERSRFVVAPPGVVCHRVADFERRSLTNTSPPRQRYDDAVIDVAATAASELDAVSALAAAVGARLTTADRLADNLASRARIPRRAFLTAVLRDVASGTCSVLEHGYLDLVERPHGLPLASRQVRESSHGTVFRDVDYPPYRLLVELDGRLVHQRPAQRDADLDRDLLAAIDGRTTVRLGWGQVFARACLTASRVGALLQQRGWTGTVHPCGECAGSQPPGDWDPARSA